MLSTKFVRTWRDKQDKNGQKFWLRRSRFVAREFAWLSPERQDLFSPASSAISSKLLPVLYLKHGANGLMMSIDVKDAFLTVDQRQPTIVHSVNARGEKEMHILQKSYLDSETEV